MKLIALIVATWLLAMIVFTLTDSEMGKAVSSILFIITIFPATIATLRRWVTSRLVAQSTLVAERVGQSGSAGPPVLLGAASIALGIVLVGWVLYNTFIERRPGNTDSTLWVSLAIAPFAIRFGVSVIRSTRRVERSRSAQLDVAN